MTQLLWKTWPHGRRHASDESSSRHMGHVKHASSDMDGILLSMLARFWAFLIQHKKKYPSYTRGSIHAARGLDGATRAQHRELEHGLFTKTRAYVHQHTDHAQCEEGTILRRQLRH